MSSTQWFLVSLALVVSLLDCKVEGSEAQPGRAAVKEVIAVSVEAQGRWPGAPQPPSELIQTVEWSPADTVIRRADGSDNWPTTWADDDQLYTAYGDGRGFEPKVNKKLSLGFAKVSGGPHDFIGTNIRTETGERPGDGRGALHARAEHRQFAGRLVRGPRQDVALGRLEVRDQLWRADLSELRQELRRRAGRLCLPLFERPR
jgi:hypothetical protein